MAEAAPLAPIPLDPPEAAGPPDLAAAVGAELELPVHPGVRALAERIAAHHGAAAAAVLFYGSCLRKNTAEGVVDFYLLVDGHRAAGSDRLVAMLGTLLPPNVFYVEHEIEGEILRSKYAVLTTDQFGRAVRGRGLDGRIWSRFCQPARLVYARDRAARETTRTAVVGAIRTAVDRLHRLLPGDGDWLRFTPADLWRRGLAETYASELRSEQPETIRALYDAQATRMDAITRLAVADLAARGRLELARPIDEDGEFELRLTEPARRSARRRWALRRPLAKLVAALGLVKTPLTFEGWVPYVLWKLERHSGVHIEVTERQRRRPFLWGWPVLFRVLRHKVLR